MPEQIIDFVSTSLMAFGVFIMLSGALGVLRMKDFFSRLHPAGAADCFGAPLVLLGAVVHYGFTVMSLKIAFLVLLLFIASPTATHILAQAALAAKLKPMLKDKK